MATQDENKSNGQTPIKITEIKNADYDTGRLDAENYDEEYSKAPVMEYANIPNLLPTIETDEFDLEAYKRQMHSKYAATRRQAISKGNQYAMIYACRLVMAVLALALAVWLFYMVDNFIAQRQFQRYHGPAEAVASADTKLYFHRIT